MPFSTEIFKAPSPIYTVLLLILKISFLILINLDLKSIIDF